MLSVTHTIVSLPVGVHVPQPVLAFGIAFLLHLFVDTLLHWNIYVDKHRWPYFWTAVDVLGGLAVAYLLLSQKILTAPVLAAILGGNLPDIWGGVAGLWQRLGGKAVDYEQHSAFLRFHAGLQHETSSPWKGLVWQGVLVLAAIWLLRL